MSADRRVFVLGAGRAGRGLTRALRASGVEVVGLHGRRDPGGADGVTVGALPPALARADVVLVAVRDEQLESALAELLAAPLTPDAVVLHASGSAEPAMLDAARASGHPAGTFHPLLPLAEPERAPALLRGAFIGIDGDEAARAAARVLAERLGARVVEIPAGAKARYHAAAVVASNFPVVLLDLATRLLAESGIEAAAARGAARSLFFAAVENLRHQEAADALTGPIVRGDVETVRRHRAALAGEPELLAAYNALSRGALRLARERGTPAEALRAMERLLE
ncbi:MAG TPA: Rossmann-like and DUF2520 domain-containing protein [Gemmatimonadaceae bacterium]|nr:Rossmann-like and DUF2520 domain-containing protein [Gemmatimonadaceae bacterium]